MIFVPFYFTFITIVFTQFKQTIKDFFKKKKKIFPDASNVSGLLFTISRHFYLSNFVDLLVCLYSSSLFVESGYVHNDHMENPVINVRPLTFRNIICIVVFI